MKPSMKQRRHLRALASMKKLKSAPTKKTQHVCSKIKKKSVVETNAEKIVQRKIVELNCSHYLIGSASFNRLLSNTYSIERAHGVMRKVFGHRVGSIGEQAFARECENFIDHPFSISLRVPFLCCTPDFILPFRDPVLIEIKTFEQIKACKENYTNICKDYILQVWSACEVFGLRKAKLIIYHYDRKSGKKNHYNQDKWVSLFGVIEIEIRADLFSADVYQALRPNYLSFFKEYLDFQGVKYSVKDLNKFSELLDKTYTSHRRPRTCGKNSRKMIIARENLTLSEFCKEKANFYSYEERFGNAEQREKEKKVYRNLRECLRIRKIQKKISAVQTRKLVLGKEERDEMMLSVLKRS